MSGMSCAETFAAYALRAIGIGERLLPRADITLCEQMVLIGSGMIWNVYFATFAILLGFCLATVLALGKASASRWLSAPAAGFIYLFRGTPLFIQFFFVYECFVLLPRVGVEGDLVRNDAYALVLRGGYFYEPSPAPMQSGLTNLFDNHRHAFTVGYSVDLTPGLAPVRVDLFGQVHALVPRTHRKNPDVPASNPAVPTAETGGSILMAGMTGTVRF